MGMILDIDDFSNGRFTINVNQEQEIDLDLYIDRVEAKYLPEAFGKELYDLFVVDWNTIPVGVPTAARFVEVFDAFTKQDDCVMITSEGIETMLKGFVYYLYLRDAVTRSTTLGLELFIGENTESVSAIQHDITSRFNEGVDTLKTIQYFMNTFNAETYPEYKGVSVEFANIV